MLRVIAAGIGAAAAFALLGCSDPNNPDEETGPPISTAEAAIYEYQGSNCLPLVYSEEDACLVITGLEPQPNDQRNKTVYSGRRVLCFNVAYKYGTRLNRPMTAGPGKITYCPSFSKEGEGLAAASWFPKATYADDWRYQAINIVTAGRDSWDYSKSED